MEYKNGKIILSEEENRLFVKNFKEGVYAQLYKEGLLSSSQLNELLKNNK